MPFDGTTSYKTQFPKHDVEPRKDYTPKEVYEPPHQPFEGQTHYNSTFRWVYLPKREKFKPEEVVYKSEMPFDGTTSYKTQFPKHDVEPRKDYTPIEVYEPPDQPFEGQTHYNSNFRWVYLPKRENFKPEEVVYRSEMPFDGTTSYKTQFPKHDVEPRKDYTPIEVYEPPDQPFEGQTHYNSNFRWVYLPKRKNFKPEEVVYRSEMPFDDTTSYKTQFPKYDVEPRKDYTPKEVYTPPENPLEGLTDGRRKNFTLKYQSKSEKFEPAEVVFLCEEPFHDASSDKIQFPKRDPKPRKDYTPKNVYIPPENPLEGLTDGRRKNFTLKYQSKSEKFEPAEVVFLCEEPFHDASSDKIQFPKRDPNPHKDYTPKNVYIPPENPLEGLTDGRRKNFTLKYQSKKENFKEEEVVFQTEVPLDDTTSYKTHLPKRDGKPRNDYTPIEVYIPPENHLEGLTDGRRKNFTLKYQSKSEKFEPAEVVFLCEEPFHDASSDKIQFPKRDPNPHKDYTPKNVYIPPENPLEGLTDGRRKNFTLKYQSKKENFKEEEVVFQTEVPLDDTTSYKTHLPKRDAKPRNDYTPIEVYIPPENPLEGLTDGRRKNFTLKHRSKKENLKQEKVVFRTEVPLDDTTSYKTHLPKRDATPRKYYSPMPPDEPLDGVTDHKGKFNRRYLPMIESMKQNEIAYKSQMMDWSSVSKLHYVKPSLEQKLPVMNPSDVILKRGWQKRL